MTHIWRIALHNGVKALINLQFEKIFSMLSQAFFENDLGLIVECMNRGYWILLKVFFFFSVLLLLFRQNIFFYMQLDIRKKISSVPISCFYVFLCSFGNELLFKAARLKMVVTFYVSV